MFLYINTWKCRVIKLIVIIGKNAKQGKRITQSIGDQEGDEAQSFTNRT